MCYGVSPPNEEQRQAAKTFFEGTALAGDEEAIAKLANLLASREDTLLVKQSLMGDTMMRAAEVFTKHSIQQRYSNAHHLANEASDMGRRLLDEISTLPGFRDSDKVVK